MDTVNNNAPNNWKEGIDTNYSDSVKDFGSVNDLVKNYHELKSAPKGLSVPENDADDDKWHGFYNQLGRPENKQYLDVNDDDRKRYAPYEEILYHSGLSKRQGQKLLNSLIDKANNEAKTHEAEQKKQLETNQKTLKDKYGDQFENSMKLVNAAVSQYGSDDIKNLVNSGQCPPVLVDYFVNVGKTLSPEKLVTGHSQNVSSKEAAIKEIHKLEADKTFMGKYRDSSHHDHDKAIQTMEKLYKDAYDG